MLSFDSVAEDNGLIYPRPSGENFSFARVWRFVEPLNSLETDSWVYMQAKQLLN